MRWFVSVTLALIVFAASFAQVGMATAMGTTDIASPVWSLDASITDDGSVQVVQKHHPCRQGTGGCQLDLFGYPTSAASVSDRIRSTPRLAPAISPASAILLPILKPPIHLA